MYLKKIRKMLAAACIAALAVSMTQGCGAKEKTQEEILAEMKEFSMENGTVTIKLDPSWTTQDMGMDFCFAAQNSSGSEAMVIMQFVKLGGLLPADSLDSVKELMDQSYQITNSADAEAPVIPGMTNLTASTCTINGEGQSGDAYLVYGETDYAYYALLYAANKMNDSKIASIKASCSSFTETPAEEEDNTTVEMTDTVRWFNASYAVLTELNGWDYNRFAGLAANGSTMELEKASLEEWWGVTDRASADETLEWILSEGHRTGFAENCKTLEEAGLKEIPAADRVSYLLENFDVDEEEAQSYADTFVYYEEFGEHATDGWDYCRAMNLLSFYYLAGYYTETEALDKSLEIAQTIQPLFESWDDLIASYMRGYELWAGESSAERQGIYEDLKTRADNPYAVDFKMTLEKTW